MRKFLIYLENIEEQQYLSEFSNMISQNLRELGYDPSFKNVNISEQSIIFHFGLKKYDSYLFIKNYQNTKIWKCQSTIESMRREFTIPYLEGKEVDSSTSSIIASQFHKSVINMILTSPSSVRYLTIIPKDIQEIAIKKDPNSVKNISNLNSELRKKYPEIDAYKQRTY